MKKLYQKPSAILEAISNEDILTISDLSGIYNANGGLGDSLLWDAGKQ